MSNKKKKLKKPLEKKYKDLKTFDIVRVDWHDHWSGMHQWSHPDDVDHTPKTCVTVGVVVKEDKNGITLAQNMGTAMQVADTTYVIKKCIVSRKVLGQLAYGKEA